MLARITYLRDHSETEKVKGRMGKIRERKGDEGNERDGKKKIEMETEGEEMERKGKEAKESE